MGTMLVAFTEGTRKGQLPWYKQTPLRADHFSAEVLVQLNYSVSSHVVQLFKFASPVDAAQKC